MNLQIPKIRHRKSGLIKKRKTWFVLYYRANGKLTSKSTKKTTLDEAVKVRDTFYKKLIRGGAIIKGMLPPSVKAAQEDPEGDACIYEQTSYRVVVAGVSVINTTDKEKAIRRRNEYIRENYPKPE